MGNGISQEQLQQHLDKQEALIRQLQAVVKQQSTSLASMGHTAVNYDVDGAGADVPLEDDLEDEVEGLRRAGNATRKVEDPVEDMERQQPAEDFPDEMTEEEERGFMSVKPWLGAMGKPTGWEYGKTDDAPNVTLELEHVYGYRAQAVRQNVVWIDKKTVLYFSAGVGIVHNVETNTQKFFRGHTDDILCLAYHPGRRIAVTGEKGRYPSIHVWDVDTCEELAKIAGFHSRGVCSVAFSLDGGKVASVGLDDNHSIAVYDWARGNLLASEEGDTARILDVQFNMTAEADSNNDFITVGLKHIKFWTVTSGGTLEQKKGLLGNLGERQAFLNSASTSQYTIVGTQNGEMYLFKGRKLAKVVAAHQKSIYAIKGYGDSVVTGGKDGYVSRWDMNTFEKTGSVNLNKVEDPAVLKHTTNYVRAVDCLSKDEIVVGTLTSSIYKVKFSTSSIQPLMQAHYGNLDARRFHGELWGIASAPNGQRFVSAGEDNTLRIWDCEQRKMVSMVQLDGPAQCVTWSPCGQYMAVGLHTGSVVFLDKDAEEIKAVTKCRRRVQSVRFSPSSKLVAVGSADNVIHIYDVESDFKFKGKLKGHSSVILKMDFSADEKYLQTCSQSYELLFFNLEEMKQHTRSRELKDTEWATFTSILGWDVQGIWPKYSDGSDVNAVTRSRDKKLLATAEDTGMVKLFQYPCVGGGLDRMGNLNRRPDSRRFAGHSEHVTDVTWTENDARVISAGGADLAIMQWKVVPVQE